MTLPMLVAYMWTAEKRVHVLATCVLLLLIGFSSMYVPQKFTYFACMDLWVYCQGYDPWGVQVGVGPWTPGGLPLAFSSCHWKLELGKPGQSHGFQAKLGQNITTRMSKALVNSSQTIGPPSENITTLPSVPKLLYRSAFLCTEGCRYVRVA